MKTKVCVIYDSKIGYYESPMFFRTRADAIRAFSDVANDTGTKFFKHGGDFTMFEVAEYDDETGSFINHEAKISYGLALDFIKPVEVMQ